MTSKIDFIRVEEGKFMKGNSPYYFIGANFWASVHLATEQPKRLVRELDQLKELGIDNLRIMGLSEGPDTAPFRVVPAIQYQAGKLREEYLKGLDFLLVEMAKRQMHAVICFSNFWPWSGGMAQYLAWQQESNIPYPPPAKDGEWWKYQLFTAAFYDNQQAVDWYHEVIRQVISRTNSITHLAYADDPTIMAWQLANEPRASSHRNAYLTWIDTSSQLIKSLAPRQLVSLGSEGDTTHPEINGVDVLEDHQFEAIDYVTIHCWIQNWGWYDPQQEGTYSTAKKQCFAYIDQQLKKVRSLGKPLVLEEFGIARDQGSYDPTSTTIARDQFYRDVFSYILQGIEEGKHIAGANFWAWAGEGRPTSPKALWQANDDLTGDPPHEHQGWYSVYDQDESTLAVIQKYAKKVKRILLKT